MTDDPLLVRTIFLTAGADPTKLTQWMNDNMPTATTDATNPTDVITPHAA